MAAASLTPTTADGLEVVKAAAATMADDVVEDDVVVVVHGLRGCEDDGLRGTGLCTAPDSRADEK